MEQLAMKWKGTSADVMPTGSGIIIRTFEPGDTDGLIEALVPLHEKIMTYDELDKIILKHDGVYPEGIFLAIIGQKIVGTTTAYFNNTPGDSSAPVSGTLHMVSVLPEANGRKLGRMLCGRAMDYLVRHGCSEIVLTTDDHRLPAIKTYLSLGFEPIINDGDADMRARWDAVMASLQLKS